MVGRGQRFRDEGFTTPKQLIEVGHKQIIDWSLSCIKTAECNLIFVIRRDTVYSHQMDDIVNQLLEDTDYDEVSIETKIKKTYKNRYFMQQKMSSN